MSVEIINDEDIGRKYYEESLECLQELYAEGFDTTSVTEKEAMFIHRLQHYIFCNVHWHIQALGSDNFPEELLSYRVRVAAQALYLLGRKHKETQDERSITS